MSVITIKKSDPLKESLKLLTCKNCYLLKSQHPNLQCDFYQPTAILTGDWRIEDNVVYIHRTGEESSCNTP